jgi:Uma2 family endonuclease
MAAVSTTVTVEEWERLDEDDDRELVDGRLEESEMPDAVHETVVRWLTTLLDTYFRPHGGFVFGAGLKYVVSAKRGRIPDLSVMSSVPPRRRGAQRAAPDLIVEVVSRTPTDQRRDRVAKVSDYAELGARWYWLIDPTLLTIEILERMEDGRYAHAAAASAGKLTAPGFPELVIDLDALWGEIDRLPPESEDE